MLQIKNISKQYKTDTLVQTALDKVSLNLRDNEFVAILGPSGSGKTTLLNIIGGLDRYDSGDLVINGISTKKYTDRDWDSYRNHTVGFVFQSYNLIPHQTILSNVELALTISGISSKERKQKAIDALKKVGLGDHIHKKPNQLSGGQMQRVAIARALVNDPDILLADEPTGALDTKTSVQVMDLLQEVAKDRLVVMVTHNPELAQDYATRIVRLRDGKITDDSDPFEISEDHQAVHKNMGKSSMSLLTAFSLSFNNLLTKKGRTLLTAFAGSIGIIGIALILSLSNGFQNYIDQIQEETLTSYPLTITSETADPTSALLSMVTNGDEANGSNVVEEKQLISSMFSTIGSNDIESFKTYLEDNKETVDEMVSLIDYSYNINPNIYTKDSHGNVTKVNPNNLINSISGMNTSMMASSVSSIFKEMIDDPNTLQSQYDVLAGRWPQEYNEMILVLNEPNGINDILVYSLGLRDSDELQDMIYNIMDGKKIENTSDPLTFTYDDFLNLSYKLIDASDTYKYNSKYDLYESMSNDQDYMKKVYDQGIDLKIVGVVCAKEGSTSTTLTTGVAYTKELTEYVIQKASESDIVKKQLANKDINVFSGKRFDDESNQSGLDFQDMISIDKDMLTSAFGGQFDQNQLAVMTQGYMAEISQAINADTSDSQELLSDTLKTLTTNLLNDYIDKNKNEIGFANIQASDIHQITTDYLNTDEALHLLNKLDSHFSMPSGTFHKMYEPMIEGIINGYIQLVGNLDDQIDINEIKSSINEALEQNNISPEIITLVNDFLDNLNKNAENLPTMINDYLEREDVQALIKNLEIEYNIPAQSIVSTFKTFINNAVGDQSSALINKSMVDVFVNQIVDADAMQDGLNKIAVTMAEARMKTVIMTKVGELTGHLVQSLAEGMNVDPQKIAGAFKFNLSEDELKRLMSAMTNSTVEQNATTNLALLGYQDINKPTTISFYFNDFESKEEFLDFLDNYNKKMEKTDEDKVIKYTDLTGILMSSVKTIVDSVSYALIAFVSISLVVSSIMIGIITYISVLERTKEIGVLRAIGASKKNITSIFNAETFMIGLCSGLIGIGITLLANPFITKLIHSLTGNKAIIVNLPVVGGIVLVLLSVLLTLIGGFIPSKQAARKDPVTALRSE